MELPPREDWLLVEPAVAHAAVTAHDAPLFARFGPRLTLLKLAAPPARGGDRAKLPGAALEALALEAASDAASRRQDRSIVLLGRDTTKTLATRAILQALSSAGASAAVAGLARSVADAHELLCVFTAETATHDPSPLVGAASQLAPPPPAAPPGRAGAGAAGEARADPGDSHAAMAWEASLAADGALLSLAVSLPFAHHGRTLPAPPSGERGDDPNLPADLLSHAAALFAPLWPIEDARVRAQVLARAQPSHGSLLHPPTRPPVHPPPHW